MALPPLPERETLRLHQANERTLLAWIRTALALMGFGFVVARFGLFLRELAAVHEATSPRSIQSSLVLGVALIAAGVIVTIVSMLRYRATSVAIERHEVGGRGNAWVIGATSAVALLGMLVLLLLLWMG